jgi:hypothetical protein
MNEHRGSRLHGQTEEKTTKEGHANKIPKRNQRKGLLLLTVSEVSVHL